MRIASLLPACTEWVAAFGAVDDLVARSHACDYPDVVKTLPVVSRPAGYSGGHADKAGTPPSDGSPHRNLELGISSFDVDLDRLVELAPDVILTQAQCDVCAVTESQLAEGLSGLFDPMPQMFSMQPSTLKDVLDHALALGRVIGRSAESMKTIAALERGLRQLRDRLGLDRRMRREESPTVAALEWAAPLMSAGHWTPDLIEMAGGRPVCANPGRRSVPMDWQALCDADPDVLAVAACSMDVEAAKRHVSWITERREWSDLRAVRLGRAYVFDGRAYFNRPGPRLYRSIELMAAAIHGDRAGTEVRPHEMQRLFS